MSVHPAVARLAAYRLAHDLTFEQLAAEMRAARCPVEARSLHLTLTNRLLTGPRERTLYKITQFLDHITTGRDVRARKLVVRKPRRRVASRAAL